MAATPPLPPGYALRHFEQLDSTNEEARRLGEAGEVGPVWIVADRQTAGRGRRGRGWASPTGNLMATLLLWPDCGAAKAGELAFVAGLAVHDAAAALLEPAKRPALRLKWPNDLLYDGAKIAGILLESSARGEHRVDWLAIGIGMNLVAYPEGTPYPATSLKAATGRTPEAGEMLASLAAAFEKRLTEWRRDGFSIVQTHWLARAAGIGAPVIVRLADETLQGLFEDLDADGALRLRMDDGTVRQIAAGDVFFPAAKR